MISVQEQIASISQSFHDDLDTIDKLRIQALERSAQMTAVRMRAGLAMEQGAGPIRRQDEVITELLSVRDKHIKAHRSAMLEATKMGWPTECPETLAQLENAPTESTES